MEDNREHVAHDPPSEGSDEGRPSSEALEAEAAEVWLVGHGAPQGWPESLEDSSFEPEGEAPHVQVSRRGFLQLSGAGAVTAQALVGQAEAKAKSKPQAIRKDKVLRPDGVRVSLKVNGKAHSIVVETRTTLAEALRESIGLTGTKVVCDRGACGGCTVQLNNKAVTSCMVLAIDAHGAEVTTIEGLAKGNQLHPLQQAFVECDALQCGYCTPGMVMSCKVLLDANPDPTLDDVKHAVSGNLCRCGTYPHVFQAALLAAKRLRKQRSAAPKRRKP